VETKALQQQVDHLTQVGQGAEAEEEKLSRELDGLTDANVRLGRDLEQSKASCTALTKKLDKAQGALSSREKELSAATSELSALKVEHSSALQQIDSLKLLVSDAETQVSFAESAKQSVEVQRSEILKAKGELQSQVALKEDTITQLRKELEDIARKNQYLLEEKLNETHVSSTAVITDLHDLLAEKTELAETLNRKLDSALELEKSYLQQIESSAEAIKKLELQVSTEQAQMQDRKTKFKSFVDKLSGEKQAAEAQCASLDKQLKEVTDRCASLEADASALRLERDNQAEKFQAELAQREQTLGGLRRSLKAAEEQSRSITEDIRAKYDEDMRLYVARTTEMKGELDELSHKRTTARSELIKMAQSLERASKEGMELKSLFQFTFLPMLQEQVASIQSILVLLESSTNQLLKKASASLQARLKAKAKSSGRVAGARRRPSIGTPEDPDDEDAGASDAATGHVPPSPQAHSSLLSNSSPLHQGGRAALAKRMNIPSINTSGGGAHPHSSSNPMPMLLEYADSCRASLDMLAGGLTLVNTSVEKLHDIVQLDNVTSCAETVGNVISGVISTFAAQPPSITTARGINRREYSTLETDTDNSTSL
jgi:chromosome segregation ATPase